MTFPLTKQRTSLKEYPVSVYQQGIFETSIWRHLLPSHFHDPLTAGMVRRLPGDISRVFSVTFFNGKCYVDLFCHCRCLDEIPSEWFMGILVPPAG